MVDISLGGLLGAVVGTIIAAAVYGAVVAFIERRYRALRVSADETASLRQELGLLRRGVLAFDLLLFCVLGYWIGDKIGG